MNTKILDNHRELLKSMLFALQNDDQKFGHDTLKKIKTFDLSEEAIYAKYNERNTQNRTDNKPPISYIRAFREWLQDKDAADLHYREAIRVISEMFDKKFKHYNYSKAVKVYWRDRLEDPINAMSEWRAYFEYRFMQAIEDFHEGHVPEHWLTINFNLYSFMEKRTMPVYRMHLGVPERHHPKYINDNLKSPDTQRDGEFDFLGPLHLNYSTVWEIVKNNISSIFYFDKTTEREKDTVIYEIDADVMPGEGRVAAKNVAKFTADESHRTKPIFEKNTSEKIDYNVTVEVARINDPKERAYQYSIMRFFIRAGIFNPQYAAYAIRPGEPAFEDKLKPAFRKLEEMRKNSESSLSKNLPRKAYEEALFNELQGLLWSDLMSVLEPTGENGEINAHCQFASTKNADRLPYMDASGEWRNFEYTSKTKPEYSKYTIDEDAALDKVLTLLDLIEPDTINIRMSIFEAGFSYLTQKDNTISHVYWTPIVINWRQQHTGGAAFINSDKRLGSVYDLKPTKVGGRDYYDDGSSIVQDAIRPNDRIPQILKTTLYYFTGLFADKINGEIEEVRQPDTERAAAVSIMSRNISHNIGSHVLSYLKNLLGNEGLMIKKGVLENLVLNNRDGTFQIKEGLIDRKSLEINEKRVTLPYLRSIGRLLGYFQERQDYIGTFASDRYLYFSPIHFKSAVVDYFAGLSSFKAADAIGNAIMRNISLDFIIFSEGYKGMAEGMAANDIIINTFWQTQNGEKIPMDASNDVEISLPSGNTGRQGIFTILENFIRNSAKHGQPKKDRKDGKMLIDIVISDNDKHFYKLQIRDNSGKTTHKVVEEIEEVLNSPLIRSDGTPDEQHKGIKEIQIAAAWLRGIKPNELQDMNVIGDRKIVDVTEVEGDLQYTLFLRKPKPGLIVVRSVDRYFEDKKLDNPILKPDFRKSLENWDFVEYRDEIKAINLHKIAYRFVLIHEELMNGLNAEEQRKLELGIMSRCPVRRLTNVTDDMLVSEHLEEDLYKRWLDGNGLLPKSKTGPRFDLVGSLEGCPSEIKIGIEDSDGNPQFAQGLSEWVVTSIEKAKQMPIYFRLHNDLPERFDNFAKTTNNFSQNLFVEGISGGNSTARIMRNEEINHLWRYKVIEAALTKIIIIDERIWNNNLADSMDDRRRNKLRFDKRNIHIMSLEYDTENDAYLCLVDLEGCIVARVGKDGRAKFENDVYRDLYRESHFISFHQGLLERALKHCSGVLSEMDESKRVEYLFKLFREDLLQGRLRVLIHSGRSKTHIMPKRTAFVQLSSLGSALRDCKMTLCELFYATIQEND